MGQGESSARQQTAETLTKKRTRSEQPTSTATITRPVPTRRWRAKGGSVTSASSIASRLIPFTNPATFLLQDKEQHTRALLVAFDKAVARNLRKRLEQKPSESADADADDEESDSDGDEASDGDESSGSGNEESSGLMNSANKQRRGRQQPEEKRAKVTK
jgi:hypothetical protein